MNQSTIERVTITRVLKLVMPARVRLASVSDACPNIISQCSAKKPITNLRLYLSIPSSKSVLAISITGRILLDI